MKLNKQIKEAILNAAMKKAGIPEKAAAIRARYAALAESVRVQHVTPEDDLLIEEAKRILKPLTEKSGSYRVYDAATNVMNVNFAGQKRRMYFNGNIDNDTQAPSVYKRTPDSMPSVTADDPRTEILYTIDHDAKALKEETEQIRVSLWAVLNSVNTDKRLVEVWPEAVAFIPAAEKAATPQLPALPIAELNKLIGLP